MSYRVNVQPDGPSWNIRVPAIGRSTMSTSLSLVDTMATDLIEIMTGEKNPEIDVHVSLPASVQQHIDESRKQREIATRSTAVAAKESREAARELRSMGMTLHDVGTALGVSYQRAHQLVNS